ncbi:hypothetical protein QJQ45_027471 [Haematococcus lacustris]|nr:hypothetical protein QJQ45_027471 [Haematococcus lacustris]
MDRAFPRCNRAITRVRGLDTQLSGCTSCVALLTPQGKVEPCGQGVTAWEFTNDHTPASPAEAARVQACGGCVAKYNVNGQAVGPLRVWCKDRDAPGLCITRSFGDALAHSIGVTEEPEVVTHSLEQSDRYLLIVSNSICEYMENQEVMEYVHAQASQGLPPEAVGKSLCQETQRRWRQHEQGLAAECTVVVVYLRQQSAEVCDSRATVSCMPSLRRNEAPPFQPPDSLLWLRLRVAFLGTVWRLRSSGAATALQPQMVAQRVAEEVVLTLSSAVKRDWHRVGRDIRVGLCGAVPSTWFRGTDPELGADQFDRHTSPRMLMHFVIVRSSRLSPLGERVSCVVLGGGGVKAAWWLRPVYSEAKRSQVRGLMSSTSYNISFYDRDVSAALNIRRCAVGPGPRPTELCYWDGRPAMPKPGRPGQEWVYLRDKALLRKWRRKWRR